MRTLLLGLIASTTLAITTAQAQSVGLSELTAAWVKLQAVERTCLYVVLRPWDESPIFARHLVAFERRDGETDADAAARSCAALAASVSPPSSTVTLFCASCETEE